MMTERVWTVHRPGPRHEDDAGGYGFIDVYLWADEDEDEDDDDRSRPA